VPSNWETKNRTVVHALHLGVRGIVYISQEFPERLLEALTWVARGQLAAKAEVLEEFYATCRNTRPQSPISGLSLREEQVLDLLSGGFSNKRISTVLGITERTAKFHVSNILHKLHIKTRKQLSNRETLYSVQREEAESQQ
jgi:DNA-binding NarL/FixJ family response regulator